MTLPIHPIALPTNWTPTGPIHVYLVKQDPVTLVDTGLNTPESRAALLAGLQEHGLEPRDIRRILLTHAHMDHCGLAGWLQDQSGAEIWLHPDEAGKLDLPQWWLESQARILEEAGVPGEVQAHMSDLFNRSRLQVNPPPVWRSLSDGQEFAFERGVLQAVHLPGHALGHTGFLEPAAATLMGGDHLLDGITPNPIMEPLPPGHSAAAPHAPYRALTLGMFLGALERASLLELSSVLPGHGPVISDHRQVAAGYQRRHELRLDRIQGLLAGGIGAFELTRVVYPRVREFDIFLALSEVLAHLDLLVVRGRARQDDGPGMRRFHLSV